MKKLTAAVLAAALTLGCASTAFANEAIDDAIELNQYNFEEKEAVSGRFLNLLASYPGETATWQTEDYAFTFRSEDVPEETGQPLFCQSAHGAHQGPPLHL